MLNQQADWSAVRLQYVANWTAEICPEKGDRAGTLGLLAPRAEWRLQRCDNFLKGTSLPTLVYRIIRR